MSDSRGFTLVEVIIAIAILAVCSVYILEMFVVSDNLSDDSSMLDGAISNANNICEYLKSSDSLQDFLSNPYIVMNGQIESGQYHEELYFDQDWRQVKNIEGCSIILDMHMNFSKLTIPCLLELNYYSYQGGAMESLFNISVDKYFAGEPEEAES